MRIRCRRALVACVLSCAIVGILPATSWAAPSVTSFTPTQGALGTVVTITGSGFTGTTSVTFGGVASSFSVSSNTSIRAVVPTLAVTNPIRVAGPSGSALSTSNFKVLPGIALSPNVGPPTTALTVAGSGFAANEPVDIYEGGTDVVVGSADAYGTFSRIPLTIPASAPPGAFWISAVGRRSVTAAQTAFTVRTDWLSGRGSAQNNGWNPYENVLDTSTVRKLQASWTTTGGSYFANVSPPVIVAGGAVIGEAPHFATITSVSASNASPAWTQPLTESFFSGPAPADGSGVLVAPSSDGKVHAYTVSTGAPRWTTAGPSDTGAGSAIVTGGDAIVPGASQIQDFALSTGARRWGYTGSCANTFSTPAVAFGTIVFTCRDGAGNALEVDISTSGAGRLTTTGGTGTTSAPAIDGANVYALLGGVLESRSISGFYQKWALTPPFSVSTDPAAGDGIVATCGSGGIWVVNAVDGSTRFSNANYWCTAPVTIANGVIYEPQGGNVVMFDEYGDPLGRLGAGAGVSTVAVSDGAVYASESITGVDRWAIPPAASTARAHARPDARRLHPNRALRPYRPHRRR